METYTSFTVANETGLTTSYIVWKEESTDRTILGFFEQSLWKTLSVTRSDSKKAVEIIAGVLPKVMVPFGIE